MAELLNSAEIFSVAGRGSQQGMLRNICFHLCSLLLRLEETSQTSEKELSEVIGGPAALMAISCNQAPVVAKVP